LAIISDTAGISKAYVGVNSEGAGYFQVMGGNRFPIAELTEGKYKGGKLTLFSTSAVPMVEAGELESGVGTVWAGPMGFNPGVGLLGLPGSFIMGKNQ